MYLYLKINHKNRRNGVWYLHLHLHYLALGKVPFWLVAVVAYMASYTTSLFRNITPSQPHFAREKDSHNTVNFTPYSFRIVCGFFNVLRWNFKHGRYCEMGPTVYSPYPRRLESLTMYKCNCKGSTFSSVILRPWVMVRPELNPRSLAWQPVAQPTEPPCAVFFTLLVLSSKIRLEKMWSDSKLAYNWGVMKKMVSRNPLILLGDWSTEISMYKAGPELFIFL